MSIIPINTEIENAQICVNLGGTPTWQINNINPTTNQYSPTTIVLASQKSPDEESGPSTENMETTGSESTGSLAKGNYS